MDDCVTEDKTVAGENGGDANKTTSVDQINMTVNGQMEKAVHSFDKEEYVNYYS